MFSKGKVHTVIMKMERINPDQQRRSAALWKDSGLCCSTLRMSSCSFKGSPKFIVVTLHIFHIQRKSSGGAWNLLVKRASPPGAEQHAGETMSSLPEMTFTFHQQLTAKDRSCSEVETFTSQFHLNSVRQFVNAGLFMSNVYLVTTECAIRVFIVL